MCGILGWLGYLTPEDHRRFETALDLLAHRGPDYRGFYVTAGIALGHRRLSIVDLSPAGYQPMVEPASGSVIVFNGEIYNHLELRGELERLGHRFVGHSDTEVLLHALVEWDVKALPRLNGMWAFAYWQPQHRRLLLARDRFGVKPLYYRSGAEGLAFASEPKALLTLFPQHRRVCERALLDFLANNALHSSERSFYEGIRIFPPAHLAVVEADGALRLVRYWDYPDEREVRKELNEETVLDEFAELFDDAVRLRLRSDVPVGLTLSGGLDSSAILAAATRWQPITSFTSTYGSSSDHGEFSWAKRACMATRSRLIPVEAPAEEWLPTLGKIAWHMDGPGYSPAVYPLWHLMRRARDTGVPVLLEGQGADECLAGYPQYAALEVLAYVQGCYTEPRSLLGLISRLQRMRATFSLRWALAWLLRETMPGLASYRRRMAGFHSFLRPEARLPESERSISPQSDPVRARLRHDHSQGILPGLLQYGDAISMAHSIEARHPFLDYRLVEWLFRVPTRFKLHEGETKWVLREYLRRHGLSVIGNRQDKKGYPTPVAAWMTEQWGREIEAMLVKSPNHLHEWCDPKAIKRLIKQSRHGALAADHHLYKLVTTQIWLDVCINGNAP